MKIIAVFVLMCAAVAAQESNAAPQPPPSAVTKLVELRNVSARTIDQLVGSFEVSVHFGQDPRFITLRGRKENVELAEQAIARMDRSKKNIEASFQILAASKEPNNEKLPAELASVIKQLKAAFVFQGFRLIETLQIRAREGTGSEASSAMHVLDEGAPSGMLQVKFNQVSVNQAEKPPMIRLDGLRFGARVPWTLKGSNNWQFAETGLNTDIDVREGQTAVVGRANLDGKEGAFFLVVNVKVLD